MLAVALNFYSVATLFYFFCESSSSIMPDSTENSWQLSLPGGFGFFFSARLGWTLVIGLIASGTLFLLFAIVAHRIARRVELVSSSKT